MLTNKHELKFFAFLGGVLFILLAASFILAHRVERGNISVPAKVAANPFDNIRLSAKAAYVLDLKTGKVLYAKDEDTRLPLASLTKVMTALVATELVPGYSSITVTKAAIDTDGDSGLQVGEEWPLKNLLDFSLTSSSNDGMRAVGLALGALSTTDASPGAIENDFIKTMNQTADKLGLKNTYYVNDTGLDISTDKAGAYGSAKDEALLFQYVLKHYPSMMAATTEPSISATSNDHITHTAENTDTIVNLIPGVVASKTGYTDLAGGNLVVAFDPELGHPLVVSILGSTEAGRFSDMVSLVNASLRAIQEPPAK